MKTLDLRVRYFQDSTPADVPCRETAFIRREFEMPLPVEETALVLVDLWNVHFIESWIERAAQVTTECVVPVIDAARKAGLTIVHAPSPSVAAQYPQLKRHKPPEPSTPSAWPPSDFRSREGDYAVYRGPRSQPPSIDIHWNKLASQLAVSPQLMCKMTTLLSQRGSSCMNFWRSDASCICSLRVSQRIGVYWAGITVSDLCRDTAITSSCSAMPRPVWSSLIRMIISSQRKSPSEKWNSNTDSAHQTQISLQQLMHFLHSKCFC